LHDGDPEPRTFFEVVERIAAILSFLLLKLLSIR